MQEPWDILVVQNRTQGRCVMFLTENELFAQFVFLLGLKIYFFLAKIYFSDKVLLWVTQQPVTLVKLNVWVGGVGGNQLYHHPLPFLA